MSLPADLLGVRGPCPLRIQVVVRIGLETLLDLDRVHEKMAWGLPGITEITAGAYAFGDAIVACRSAPQILPELQQ